MTSNYSKITLEWLKIKPVDPKCVFVLCGMIFLPSGRNVKIIGLSEEQIYAGYIIASRNGLVIDRNFD